MMEVPEWLSHLRRDRRGLPVPYVNLWGPEDSDRTDVRYDPHVQMRAVFLDDADEAVPDFTRQNAGRQRECVVAGLCQVCRRQVPWSRRFLVVGDLSLEKVKVEGVLKPVSVLSEPWLDERCARFALKVCPGLIRRTRAENLRLVKVTSNRQVQLIVSRGWVEGRWEAETKEEPVAMWAKVALLGYEVAPL